MRIADAMEYAADAYVEHRVDFVSNLFDADFHDATVVTLYLGIHQYQLPRLAIKLKRHARGAHTFHMGDWQPDNARNCASPLNGGSGQCRYLVWEGVDGNITRLS